MASENSTASEELGPFIQKSLFYNEGSGSKS